MKEDESLALVGSRHIPFGGIRGRVSELLGSVVPSEMRPAVSLLRPFVVNGNSTSAGRAVPAHDYASQEGFAVSLLVSGHRRGLRGREGPSTRVGGEVRECG